ncbi:MAG: hypothetical protein ACRD0K_29650 [Egibacteraceae bacterium]
MRRSWAQRGRGQSSRVDGLVGVPAQGDVGVDVTGAFSVLAVAKHGDEPAQLAVAGPQNALLVGEGDAAGLASPAQRHHEATAGRELST